MTDQPKELPANLPPLLRAPKGGHWKYRGRYWQPPLGALVAFCWPASKTWNMTTAEDDDLVALGTHWVEFVPDVDWQSRAESLEAAGIRLLSWVEHGLSEVERKGAVEQMRKALGEGGVGTPEN